MDCSFLLHRYEVIGVTPMLQVGDYLSTFSRMVLAFGAMFELPVIEFFTARVGLIDHRFFIRHTATLLSSLRSCRRF